MSKKRKISNEMQLVRYQDYFQWLELPAEIRDYIIQLFDPKTALNFAQTHREGYDATCRLYREQKLRKTIVNTLCVKVGKNNVYLECITHTKNDPQHRPNKLETCWRCLRQCPHLGEYFKRFCIDSCRAEFTRATITSLPLVLQFIHVQDAVGVANIKYAKGPTGRMADLIDALEKESDTFDEVAKIVMERYQNLGVAQTSQTPIDDGLSIPEHHFMHENEEEHQQNHRRRLTRRKRIWSNTQQTFGRGCFEDPELVYYTKYRATQLSSASSFPDITWAEEHVEEKEIVVRL